MAQPQKIKVKKVGDYVLLQQIGVGSFGSVWLSQYADKNRGSQQFAIKEMRNDTGPGAHLNQLLRKREINNMYKQSHKNIIELVEIFTTTNNCYLVMEYASGGSLKQYLINRNKKISESEALYFIQQLAEGLKVLYDSQILHRDLKPDNLLLSDNSQSPILKICDLGLSKCIEDEGEGQTKCGTKPYMAHEILKGGAKYNYKVDL